VRAVEDLLDDGAIHANAQDYDGRRPLHLAAGEEHLEVVTLLLSRGADPGVRDRWGHAPLDGCSHDGPCEQALIKAGAPPRRMDGSQGGDQTPRDGGCEFITDPQDVELLERLGGGSFGVVYRATWRGTPVAAKCLRATVLICVAIKLEAPHALTKRLLDGVEVPRHRRNVVPVIASARWREDSTPSTRCCLCDRVGSTAWRTT
jgi:hypothetical protein